MLHTRGLVGGHYSHNKTSADYILEYFTWPGLRGDVKRY